MPYYTSKLVKKKVDEIKDGFRKNEVIDDVQANEIIKSLESFEDQQAWSDFYGFLVKSLRSRNQVLKNNAKTMLLRFGVKIKSRDFLALNYLKVHLGGISKTTSILCILISLFFSIFVIVGFYVFYLYSLQTHWDEIDLGVAIFSLCFSIPLFILSIRQIFVSWPSEEAKELKKIVMENVFGKTADHSIASMYLSDEKF